MTISCVKRASQIRREDRDIDAARAEWVRNGASNACRDCTPETCVLWGRCPAAPSKEEAA